MKCDWCDLEAGDSLDGFTVVRRDNKAVIVLRDGIGHCFRKIRAFSEVNSRIASAVNHTRFHTNRNVFNPKCPLCQKEKS